MKVNFPSATFVTSCADPKTFLKDKPTILFAGRSNAGKSTLINTLCQQKNLMKTSQTPGKTRLINYALVDKKFYIADSPGYGFESEKNYFYKLMNGFFQTALDTLKGLVVVIDSRRGVLSSDQQMLDYAAHFGVKTICVFTKADKLNGSQIHQAKEKFLKEHPDSLLLFSGFKMPENVQAIREAITELALAK